MKHGTIKILNDVDDTLKRIIEMYWDIDFSSFSEKYKVSEIADKFNMTNSQISKLVKWNSIAYIQCPCPCGKVRECRTRNDYKSMVDTITWTHHKRTICEYYEKELKIQKESIIPPNRLFADTYRRKVYDSLCEQFNIVCPNISLKTLVDDSLIRDILAKQVNYDYFMKAYVSLLVCDTNGVPSFAIEFRETNYIKQRILEAIGIQVFHLPNDENQIPFRILDN